MTRITVVVAEDHPVFRRGLLGVLAEAPDFEIVGEAGDGDVALELIRTLEPQIALLDIGMPGRNGFAIAEAVRDEGLATAVVMLTMHRDAPMLRRALDLGALGYVLKDSAVTELVACLRSVSLGRAYVSPALSSELIARNADPLPEGLDAVGALTPAERRVLRQVAADLTSAEIASALGIATKTVENHRANISRKLNVHGPQALLRFALSHKALLE